MLTITSSGLKRLDKRQDILWAKDSHLKRLAVHWEIKLVRFS